jgi:hypothetical protein
VEAVWGFIGVLLGAAIASGYSFWQVWRTELGRGVAATHALEDEMRTLQDDLTFATTTRHRRALDVEPAMTVWREQRGAIVLYVDSEDFTHLGAGVLASERWARSTAAGANDRRLEAQEIDAAKQAVLLLDSARSTLRSLGVLLRKEHDRFILSTLVIAVCRSVSRRSPFPVKAKDA